MTANSTSHRTAGRTAARFALSLAAACSVGIFAASSASADVLESIPAPTIVTSPVNPSNSAAATIEFVGGPGNLFDCSVDAGSFAPCTSPLVLGPLGEGLHSVVVRQRTPGGDVSAEVAVVAWDVDTIAPAAPKVTSDRTGFTSSDSATITIVGDGVSTFTCSVNGGDYEDCDSPFAVTGLTDGDATVSVKQVDAAGNESAAKAVSWTVDTVAPDAPAVTSNRTGVVPFKTASVSFSGEFGASFRCKVDSEPAFTACGPSPKSLTALAEGAHTVAVKQVDRAGNISDEASVSWTVDTVAPAAPTASVNRSTPTNLRTAQLTFSGEADATFECLIDNGPIDGCTSPVDYSGLTVGTHSFKVRQADQAGNQSPWKTVDWTVADVTVSRQPTVVGASANGVAIGASLTAAGEQFGGSPGVASLSFRWQRCPASGSGACADIAGATSRSYTVVEADGGSTLRFTATHLSTEGSSATAASARTSVVLPEAVTPPQVAVTASLDNVFGYGRTLSVSGLTWKGLPTGISLRYRWDRCLTSSASSCRPISYVGSSTLVPGVFELGRRVRVAVGAPVGDKVVWATSGLSPIIRVRGFNTSPPRLTLPILGTSPFVGIPVTVEAGTWVYTRAGKLSYRWQACTAPVPGACYSIDRTALTWSPRSNFVGKRLRVLETYTGNDGTKVTAASAITGPILAG